MTTMLSGTMKSAMAATSSIRAATRAAPMLAAGLAFAIHGTS
ncbi:hypothetical protein ACWFPY_09645 [Nocardia fluminea]